MSKAKPQHIQDHTLWAWRRLILKSTLTPSERHVLLTLGCYMRDTDTQCYIAISEIANDTGLTVDQVEHALRTVSIQGWIDVVVIELDHLHVTRLSRP